MSDPFILENASHPVAILMRIEAYTAETRAGVASIRGCRP